MKNSLIGKVLLVTFAFCSLGLNANAAKIQFVNVKSPTSCPAFKQVISDLDVVKFPSDWTVYVSCDRMTWDTIRQRADNPNTDVAMTERGRKFTIINALMYQPMYNFGPYTQKTPLRALKHELGHVICDSPSEKIADDFVDKGVCR
jgi:hypothetical protein